MSSIKSHFLSLHVAILFAAICMCLVSCRHTESAKDISEISIDVNQRSDAATIFSGYKYIPLETTDNSILGEIKSLDVSDSLIAAQCGDEIYLFDHNGKYINTINRKGHGPEEYIRIQDFKLHGNQVWVMSGENKAIFVYLPDVSMIKKIPFENPYVSFTIYDDHTICLASGSCNDSHQNFVFFDTDKNEVISQHDEFTKNESITFSDSPIVGKNGETLYVTHPFDHNIYALTKESFEPVEEYMFNTKLQLPDNSKEMSYIDLYDQTMNRNVVCNLTTRHDTKNFSYLIFPLFGQYGIVYDIVQLKDGKQLNLVAVQEVVDKDYPYLSDHSYTIYKDMMVSVLTPESIMYIEDNNGLHLFKDMQLKEDDNPVVFMHKLR